MPLANVQQNPFKQGRLSKFFMGVKFCKICHEPNPDIDVVASFVTMFTCIRGEDEHHYAHNICLENALLYKRSGGQLPDEISIAVAHYEDAVDDNVSLRRLRTDAIASTPWWRVR